MCWFHGLSKNLRPLSLAKKYLNLNPKCYLFWLKASNCQYVFVICLFCFSLYLFFTFGTVLQSHTRILAHSHANVSDSNSVFENEHGYGSRDTVRYGTIEYGTVRRLKRLPHN